MWYSQILVFILAFQATRQESPFVEFKERFDSNENLGRIISNIYETSKNATSAATYYLHRPETCTVMNSTIANNYLLDISQSMNRSFMDMIETLDKTLTAGSEFLAASEIVLKYVNNDLVQINKTYEKLKKLIEDLAETKNAISYENTVNTFIRDAMNDESPLAGEKKVDENMERIYKKLYVDESSHLYSQILEYDSSINRCSKYEFMQNVIYYSYLRLVGAEIQSLITITLANFLHPSSYDTNDVVNIASKALQRMSDYRNLVINTMKEASPKCECMDKNPLIQIKAQQYGIIDEFYPVQTGADDDEDNERTIRFYTNITQNICVHLSTGPEVTKTVLEVCLSEAIKSRHSIRKKNIIQKIEKTDDLTNFDDEKYRLFNFEWTVDDPEGTVLIVSNEKSTDLVDILLMYEDTNNDLSKITHFAVTFPHYYKSSYWYLEKGPLQHVGFSSLVTGTKACFCPVESDDIEGSFFAADRYDGSLMVCKMHYEQGGYACHGATNEDGVVFTEKELIMMLQGCQPDINPAIDPSVVTNQYASVHEGEVKFSQYCEIDGEKGIYSPVDNRCITMSQSSGQHKILSI